MGGVNCHAGGGIMPGEATWNDAYAILWPFTETYGSERMIKKGESLLKERAFKFYISSENHSVIALTTQNDKVIEIGLGPNSTSGRYAVHKLLTKYGKPGKIFITTRYSVPFFLRAPPAPPATHAAPAASRASPYGNEFYRRANTITRRKANAIPHFRTTPSAPSTWPAPAPARW